MREEYRVVRFILENCLKYLNNDVNGIGDPFRSEGKEEAIQITEGKTSFGRDKRGSVGR